MIEYINKNSLLEEWKSRDPETHDKEILFEYQQLSLWVNYIPTVTKVDICREFVDKLKEKYAKIYANGMPLSHDSCLAEMYEVLEEMENEE